MSFIRRLLGSKDTPDPSPEAPPVAPEAPPAPPASCPHCGHVLDPIPPRRRLCPDCRAPIIPRTRADGVRVVLGEDQLSELAAWDAAWRAEREHESWLQRAVDDYGYRVAEIEALDAELQAKDPRYSDRDIYWHAADRAILRDLKAGDWGGLAAHYAVMALQVYREAETDATPPRALELMRQSSLATLRSYAESGCSRVELIRCACRVCSAGRAVRKIPDELVAPSIPHETCLAGWCSCDYAPIV